MTAAMHAHLTRLSDRQRDRLARESTEALRLAWPHRHTSLRAPHVIRANVTMIRNLRSI